MKRMTGLTSGRGAAYNVTRKIKLVMGLKSDTCGELFSEA